MTAKQIYLACLALFCLLPGSVVALDSLMIGGGVDRRNWRNVRASAELVTVRADSIFKWDVAANMNLSPGLAERGGGLTGRFALDDSTLTRTRITGLDRLVDGDAGTAFNPDDLPEVPRLLRVVVDLGGTFSVDRIRLFPRLDQHHRLFFPQLFRISTHDGTQVEVPMGADPDDVRTYIPIGQLNFGTFNPNQQPLVEEVFTSRDVRYIRLDIQGGLPWEVAELEVYSDGKLPLGQYTTQPLAATTQLPIWGRVFYDGGSIEQLPIILQTRTGPDRNPIQYFRRTGVGDDLEEVGQSIYNAIPEEERGPVRNNPDWSGWRAVSDGLVRSPSLMRFIQVRIFFPEPGTTIRRLGVEFSRPPVVHELTAEVDPRLVDPGVEERFTLSVLAHLVTSRVKDRSSTGFRRLQVMTDARIATVEEVRVDDRPVVYSVRSQPGEGFTINFGRRISQDGSFIQVVFRAAVFRDGTRMEVRALDNRVVDRRLEEVYQVALERDIDSVSVGGDLIVRLREGAPGERLLANLTNSAPVMTPNGDGVHDSWSLEYDLLKLTQPAFVRVGVYDIGGRRLRLLYESRDGNGRYSHNWDGTDDRGGNRTSGHLYLSGGSGRRSGQENPTGIAREWRTDERRVGGASGAVGIGLGGDCPGNSGADGIPPLA